MALLWLLRRRYAEAIPVDHKLAAMSKPFLDKKATDHLNLSVLRRVDPDTEQVTHSDGIASILWAASTDHERIQHCRCLLLLVMLLYTSLTQAKRPG